MLSCKYVIFKFEIILFSQISSTEISCLVQLTTKFLLRSYISFRLMYSVDLTNHLKMDLKVKLKDFKSHSLQQSFKTISSSYVPFSFLQS